MPRRAEHGRVPDWDDLYECAAAQAGFFTLAQAAEAGYSPQLIQYCIHAGRVERARRGVMRLVHYPTSDHEDLVPIWLWSEQLGVFGMETALAMHGLSDALPAHHDLILPKAWAARRLRAPSHVRLFYDDVAESDRQWMGPVPVTTPARTLLDCMRHHISPDLVTQAVRQAVARGVVTRATVRAMESEVA
ncbi:MAG: type IV toxin-antitoxin system AbiEi family antitoxin domain-containing protein [Sandaracinaceae bacterium]|nr:type IV toxin-antitoxin system AbiEi family antitoxin domain-containing protein [Sandaracinaceae bacterium]